MSVNVRLARCVQPASSGTRFASVPVLPLLPVLVAAVLLATPVRAATTISFDVDIWGGVLTASYLSYFNVEGDIDYYDGLPHSWYWICLQTRAAFDVQPQCDQISFDDGYGPGRGVEPFEEALNPLRGERVLVWVQAYNHETAEWDTSLAHEMRAALSNVALRPPGHEDSPPFSAVYPTRDDVFESVDDFIFRWPKTTTGLAGIYGGNNTGASKHELTLSLQQSSATCERTKWACPASGSGNACASTDPLSCAESERGYCTYTEPCSLGSDTATFRFDVTGLTASSKDVGPGRAWEEVIDGYTHIVFSPDEELYEPLLSQVNADLVLWRVATCTTINGIETCGRSENISQLGVGVMGIPVPVDDGGVDLSPPGTAFGDSPLVDTFRHPACIGCHILERDATATPPVGRGASHANLVSGGTANFDNPSACANCHGSDKAPQILGSSYADTHGLGSDYDAWWAWFAPEYEGALTWPEHLEDPTSADYDPATACALFKQETPTADAMKHHLFADPRVVWSIVGGDKPNGNFIAELAPPGSGLGQSSPVGDRLAVLAEWEQWVDEWVDDGMNCGTTLGGSSYGGGGNEETNTTPPTTTSDGSSGTWVGGAPGSGDVTIAHLDCQPDQDSASDHCAWTFFACGSDGDAVQTRIAACSEENAVFYKPPEVASPVGLCDQAVTASCYKIDPADGSSGYHSIVQIPAEIGDRTTLSYFSIDVEGNQEIARSETYDFVDADLTPPSSGVELFYDIDAAEHKLRFSCYDNSATCMIFYKSNDPGEDSTPELDMPTQLLNSHGGPFNSHDNVLGYLKTDRVQRIRWAAIDGAAGQKNVEFDRLCKSDALDLCPGKLSQQNECVVACVETLRSTCELGCAAGGGAGSSGEVESDCVAQCVADSSLGCASSCAETCEPTNTGCPGTGGSTGVPLDTSCNSRTNPVQCYHEFVYDPAVASDTDPPDAFWSADLIPRSDGSYERGFRVSLLCTDPVNDCELFYTADGSEPSGDPRLRYTDSIVVAEPTTGRTATTTLTFFARDNAVPPNDSPMQSVTLTVALPHTDDDVDGFSEDDGDCNDDSDQIFPGAPEICDLIDNDCDGLVDDAPLCASDAIFGDGFELADHSAWSAAAP